MSENLHGSVSYQGVAGAFSEDAAVALFGESVRRLACTTFAAALDALRQGRVERAVLPIENTLAGTVGAVMDLLIDSQVEVVAERVLEVEHVLVVAPGVKPEQIRSVRSHPVALAQCERLFREHPHWAPTPVFDTAGALAEIIAGRMTDAAALASRRAARLYGGMVIDDGVQDERPNYTRFLGIALAGSGPVDRVGPLRTSVVFTLANRPAALWQALGHFALRGVDLSKIESRPARGRPFEYAFWLDIVGGIDEPDVAEALRGLAGDAAMVRVLGTYERDDRGRRTGVGYESLA